MNTTCVAKAEQRGANRAQGLWLEAGCFGDERLLAALDDVFREGLTEVATVEVTMSGKVMTWTSEPDDEKDEDQSNFRTKEEEDSGEQGGPYCTD